MLIIRFTQRSSEKLTFSVRRSTQSLHRMHARARAPALVTEVAGVLSSAKSLAFASDRSAGSTSCT